LANCWKPVVKKKKKKLTNKIKGQFFFFQRKESFGICGNQSYFFQVRKKKPVGNTFGTYTTPTTTTLSHWWKFVQKVGFPFCHRFGSDISYLLQIKSDDTKFAKTFIPRKNIANKERKKEVVQSPN
jgi:hypothetical protein